jgi:hypothetical protein
MFESTYETKNSQTLKLCLNVQAHIYHSPHVILLKWIVATFFYAFQFVMNGSLYFFIHLCKHLHPHISTMIFKICTFALIPIGPIEAFMWSFLWNLSKKYFSLKFYEMLPICSSLFKANRGVNIINTQHDWICWSKLLQQIDAMDILHTDDKVYYLPLEQNALEKNMAWLTGSKGVEICQCYAIPYPKII